MTAPAVGTAVKAVGGKVPRGTRRARKAAAASAAQASATPAVSTAPAPEPEPEPEPEPSQVATNPDNSGVAGGSTKSPKPAKSAPAGASRSSMSLPKADIPQPVSSGAGFLLALMFWTWVAIPFLNNGGVAGVRAQLKAKFTNKAPDGSWLP